MIDVKKLLSNNNVPQPPIDNENLLGIIEGVKACSIANNLSSIIIDFDERKTIFMSENLIYLNEATITDFKRTSEKKMTSSK